MQVDVTVAVSAYKAEQSIGACIESILAQTVKEFGLVVVEDWPHDGTQRVIEALPDRRIRYLKSPTHIGIARSRNMCLRLAEGRHVFFTDADSTVCEDWIEEGLKTFRLPNCVGVEGRIYYVSRDYKHSYSDAFQENKWGGRYMTTSMSYTKKVLEQLGGFDGRYTYHEDRDLALRAMKYGNIYFNPKMIAYGQQSTWKPIEYVKAARRISNRVLLYKKFGDKPRSIWRILFPERLVAIIFPAMIFGIVLQGKCRTRKDFALLPFAYARLVYERIILWDTCARESIPNLRNEQEKRPRSMQEFHEGFECEENLR